MLRKTLQTAPQNDFAPLHFACLADAPAESSLQCVVVLLNSGAEMKPEREEPTALQLLLVGSSYALFMLLYAAGLGVIPFLTCCFFFGIYSVCYVSYAYTDMPSILDSYRHANNEWKNVVTSESRKKNTLFGSSMRAFSPLHTAIAVGNTAVVSEFLDRGCSAKVLHSGYIFRHNIRHRRKMRR